MIVHAFQNIRRGKGVENAPLALLAKEAFRFVQLGMRKSAASSKEKIPEQVAKIHGAREFFVQGFARHETRRRQWRNSSEFIQEEGGRSDPPFQIAHRPAQNQTTRGPCGRDIKKIAFLSLSIGAKSEPRDTPALFETTIKRLSFIFAQQRIFTVRRRETTATEPRHKNRVQFGQSHLEWISQ